MPATILVVEDEPLIAELVAVVLEGEGHRVLLAADGLAGLEAIKRGSFGLLVTDYMLPPLRGHGPHRPHARQPAPRHPGDPDERGAAKSGCAADAPARHLPRQAVRPRPPPDPRGQPALSLNILRPARFAGSIAKPFDLGTFLETVRTVLTGDEGGAPIP